MEWRPVVGHEGAYEVSDTGSVRSLTRVVKIRHHGIGPFIDFKVNGKLLSPKRMTTKYGAVYLRIQLWNKGKNVFRYIQCLVAESFIPKHASEQPLEVNHKSGVTTDNNVRNLEWTTRQQNAQHARTILKKVVGEGNHFHKLKEPQVMAIRAQLHRSNNDLAKEFNVSRGTIDFIRKNQTWKNLL